MRVWMSVVVSSLRRDEGGLGRFFTAVGEAWVRGVPVDWSPVFAGRDVARVSLPTYPFQRERYWLATPTTHHQPRPLALEPLSHPLLTAIGARVEPAGLLLTGLLSRAEQPWLVDHALRGTVLLPGTAFVDIALRAGAEAGTPRLDELTLEAPLLLDGDEPVRVQIVCGTADECGRRAISIHSQRQHAALDEPWTRHASGALAPAAQAAPAAATEPTPWPPTGSVAVDIADRYQALGERGYDYGPAFRGLRNVWRRDDELFVEATLPADLADSAQRYGIHPALLDAVLHAVGLGAATLGPGALDPTGDQPLLPFAWSGITLHAVGAATLRARLTPAGPGAVALDVADGTGAAVVSVASIALRPISAEQLDQARTAGSDSLFSVDWVAVPAAVTPTPRWAVLGDDPAVAVPADVARYPDLDALRAAVDAGADVPQALILAVAASTGEDVPARLRSGTDVCLRQAQAWLGDDRFDGARLVVLTRGAVAAGAADDVTDLPLAAVWGLVRVAQTEHPDRFVLMDIDDDAQSWTALPAALATGEPQLAIRAGALLAPRLARTPQGTGDRDPWAGDGTVLLTGATGSLGRMIARHLADRGVRHLLLVSRSGDRAPGAADLIRELTDRRVDATLVACDVGDREAVRELLAGIRADRPLRAVVHAAAVLDDGVVEALGPARFESVLSAKADGAWHLHDLTQGLDLRAFVLFSSVVGGARRRRAGQLRRGQRVPRRTGAAPGGARPARDVAGVGYLDRLDDGEQPRLGRPPPPRSPRTGPDLLGRGPGDVRRRGDPGHRHVGADPAGHRRPASGTRPRAAVAARTGPGPTAAGRSRGRPHRGRRTRGSMAGLSGAERTRRCPTWSAARWPGCWATRLRRRSTCARASRISASTR